MVLQTSSLHAATLARNDLLGVCSRTVLWYPHRVDIFRCTSRSQPTARAHCAPPLGLATHKPLVCAAHCTSWYHDLTARVRSPGGRHCMVGLAQHPPSHTAVVHSVPVLCAALAESPAPCTGLLMKLTACSAGLGTAGAAATPTHCRVL